MPEPVAVSFALLVAYSLLATLAVILTRRSAPIDADIQARDLEIEELREHSENQDKAFHALTQKLAEAKQAAACEWCDELLSRKHKGERLGWSVGRMRQELHDALSDKDKLERERDDAHEAAIGAIEREQIAVAKLAASAPADTEWTSGEKQGFCRRRLTCSGQWIDSNFFYENFKFTSIRPVLAIPDK